MKAVAANGGQTVTVTKPVGEGMQRRYLITDANKQPSITTGTTASLAGGWVAIPTDGHVSGAAGKVITVTDCTSVGDMIYAVGSATLPAPNAG